MEKDLVVKEAVLEVRADKVWRAITNSWEMEYWYFSIDDFKAEPGFEFKIYGERKGIKFPISCIVQEAVLNKVLSYTWSYDDFPAETLVRFKLNEIGGHTQLRLTHSGLEKIPGDNADVSVHNHREGWDFIIDSSLKQYLEKESFDS